MGLDCHQDKIVLSLCILHVHTLPSYLCLSADKCALSVPGSMEDPLQEGLDGCDPGEHESGGVSPSERGVRLAE